MIEIPKASYKLKTNPTKMCLLIRILAETVIQYGTYSCFWLFYVLAKIRFGYNYCLASNIFDRNNTVLGCFVFGFFTRPLLSIY